MMEKLPEQKINRSRNHRMSEYRKANIVYFLSRNGVVEHPHLIRVHHLHNSGVHLRDVKRWLVELRGKEMPDSFAWSYKRKYRSGYIWEDIKNDDLITPISDNEYILKGSYLLSHALDGLHVGESDKKEKIFDEEENRKPKECESVLVEKEEETNLPETQPKLDTTNRMEKPKQKSNNQNKRITLLEIDASKIITIPDQDEEKVDAPQVCRSYSTKASTVFRNILSCRKADADESALHHGETRSRRRSTSELPDRSSRKSMSVDGQYKPAGAPNCSLCGKAFKPGKMVSHMKTCEGLLGRGKQRMDTTAEKIPLRRRESGHSFSDHF